jgi:hypothetical protein
MDSQVLSQEHMLFMIFKSMALRGIFELTDRKKKRRLKNTAQ